MVEIAKSLKRSKTPMGAVSFICALPDKGQNRLFSLNQRKIFTSTTPLNIAKHVGIVEFLVKDGHLLLNKTISRRFGPPLQYITLVL